MPSTTEEFRRVMRVEANAWLCMSARYKAKPWLHGLVAADVTKFVDFILGDRVYGIQLPSSTTEFGQKVKPDWSIVLAYEYKLRKEAMKLVTQQSKTLSEALHLVTKDADLKEAFFRTPIALKANPGSIRKVSTRATRATRKVAANTKATRARKEAERGTSLNL